MCDMGVLSVHTSTVKLLDLQLQFQLLSEMTDVPLFVMMIGHKLLLGL